MLNAQPQLQQNDILVSQAHCSTDKVHNIPTPQVPDKSPGASNMNPMVIPPPITPAVTAPSMTRCEQKLKFGHSRRRDKSQFKVLHNDDNYIRWYHIFSAEIDAKNLSRGIDPKFNPATLTDYHDKLLWDAQQVCFWTVILYVCQSDIGKDAVNNNPHTCDTRETFRSIHDFSVIQDRVSYNFSTQYHALVT